MRGSIPRFATRTLIFRVMDERISQRAVILTWLLDGRTVTPIDALNGCGCFRLGARIWELRHRFGYPVKTRVVSRNGKQFAGYYLDFGNGEENAD